MQAVLMAGGKGTRLRPFTNVLPKPLVPIGEISILELVLRQLRHFGFEDIIIAVGHKAELIMAVIGDGSRLGLRIRYNHEESPRGTIGALAEMEGLEENFLVMNGDICTDMNFADILLNHASSGVTATVATFPRREQIELGVIKLDEQQQYVVSFEEKPTLDVFVSMGVNAFNKSVLDLIPPSSYFGVDSLVLKMIREQIPIRSHQFDGVWHDIGRPDDYQRVLNEYEENPHLLLPVRHQWKAAA